MTTPESTAGQAFQLHPRLAADTHRLAESADGVLLLMNNALVPWFILVPKTDRRELHQLAPDLRQRVRDVLDAVAGFIEVRFSPDKLNIAAIGNLVPQLHIHLIGRSVDDFCWPAPVWGRPERREYTAAEIARIRALVSADLGEQFRA